MSEGEYRWKQIDKIGIEEINWEINWEKKESRQRIYGEWNLKNQEKKNFFKRVFSILTLKRSNRI